VNSRIWLRAVDDSTINIVLCIGLIIFIIIMATEYPRNGNPCEYIWDEYRHSTLAIRPSFHPASLFPVKGVDREQMLGGKGETDV